MIGKKFYRRLALLEVELAPLPEPKVWQIVYSAGDGKEELGTGLNGIRRATAVEKERRLSYTRWPISSGDLKSSKW